jgi:N,N-dimethylformamidase
MKIIGYSVPITVRPGASVEFKISTDEQHFDASLVRLVGGMVADQQAQSVAVELPGLGRFSGRVQRTHIGSYADLPVPPSLGRPRPITFQFWIRPSSVGLERRQSILATDTGLELQLRDGKLVLATGEHACSTTQALENNVWYFIAIRVLPDHFGLTIERVGGWAAHRLKETVEQSVRQAWSSELRAIRLAASIGAIPDSHYNGKIESVAIYDKELTPEEIRSLREGKAVAATPILRWAFEREMGTESIFDVGPHGSHGTTHNLPTRAVTGHGWNGDVLSYSENPSHYGAIAFHDDDLFDSGWETDLRLAIPEDFASGVYALQVSAGGESDSIPFFVRGARSNSKHVLFLAPTNTYLAYANERLAADFNLTSVVKHEIVLSDVDRFIIGNTKIVGKSLYDRHTDGSPVCFSSWLRPILNFRPNYLTWLNAGPRHFPADLLTVGWLEKRGVGYEVATDEDLDRDGLSLLSGYKVLITGTHPEYWSEAALKAVQTWLNDGGRLMYLGANGFYWITGFMGERRQSIEVRRGTSATRTADTDPGEGYLATTSRMGGIWRHRGHSPQALTGVGFAAQGWGGACGYKRLAASFAGPGKRFFEGIDDSVIGNFGTVMGGAVGDEIDRLDYELGTPSHALWLATSTGLNDFYQLVHEDILISMPGTTGGTESDRVRADIVAFDIEGGGKVFSVGSINYAGAMATNDYNNNAARLADNVLAVFLNE